MDNQLNNKIPVSVFIIAKNEADRIGYTILSVKDWVDEIIVIDSGSSDDTVKISQELGARVIFRAWEGYGPQKVFGESLCRNDWILNLDADEEISELLKKEIVELFTSMHNLRYKMYRIDIRLQTRFRQKPAPFAPSNQPVRLYNKNFAGFKESTVHDSVISKSIPLPIGRLKNHINHRSFRSYAHAVEKINYYSTLQAEDFFRKRRQISSIRLLIEPFFAFFKAYIFRRYVLFGVEGIIESFIYSFARTLRMAKVRELYLEEKYKNKQ